jgi:hypothetical protein
VSHCTLKEPKKFFAANEQPTEKSLWVVRVGKIIRRMYEESEFMLRLAGKFPAARRLQHLQKV